MWTDFLPCCMLGLRYRQMVTLRRVWVVVVCIWSISALTSTGASFSVSKTMQKVANSTFYVLVIISVKISAFSYVRMFFTLRRQQAQIHENLQQEQTNWGRNQLNIARYKKTVYSIAWVQLALLICYLPCSLLWMLHYFDKPSPLTKIYVTLESSVTLPYLNSSLNPVLYCRKIKDVRQGVKSTIREVCCWY